MFNVTKTSFIQNFGFFEEPFGSNNAKAAHTCVSNNMLFDTKNYKELRQCNL
jgi:hypothetical protein